jgi:hypothetical protein
MLTSLDTIMQTLSLNILINSRTHIPGWKYPRWESVLVNNVLNKLTIYLYELVQTLADYQDLNASRSLSGVSPDDFTSTLPEGVASFAKAIRPMLHEDSLSVG